MAVFDSLRRIALKLLENRTGGGNRGEFVCADCERWEACGLQSSDTCLVKVEQLRRYEQSRWLRNVPPQRWAASPWDGAL
jgi:hypothetical protein